jgi:hypothetical protein
VDAESAGLLTRVHIDLPLLLGVMRCADSA